MRRKRPERSGIGGSDLAAILQLDHRRSAIDVFLRITDQMAGHERSPEAEPSDPMVMGRIGEPVILMMLAEDRGHPIAGRWLDGDPCLFYPGWKFVKSHVRETQAHGLLGRIAHPDRPWQSGEVDGLGVDDNGEVIELAETKAIGWWTARQYGKEGTDQVSYSTLTQVQWYLDILHGLGIQGVPAVVPILIAGQHRRSYPVSRDPVLARMLVQVASEFWQRCIDFDPPAAEPTEAGKKALARLYSGHTEGKEAEVKTLTVTGQRKWQDKADEYRAALIERERVATRVLAVENWIKQEMEDAARVLGPGWGVSWKRSRDTTRVDHEAVAGELRTMLEVRGVGPEELDGIVERHTSPVPGSRRFNRSGSLRKLEEDQDGG